MARSKENIRQNKAMQAILRGETPEKRLIVAVEDKEFKEKMRLEREEERKKSAERFDSLKEFRMPWFCPKCSKTMKKRLDNKFWRIAGHCFDCQVEMENKLRVEGKWKEYEKSKIFENKKAYLKDLNIYLSFKEYCDKQWIFEYLLFYEDVQNFIEISNLKKRNKTKN